MKRTLLASALGSVLVSFLALAACLPPATTPGPYGTAPAAATAEAQAGGLSRVQILQCFQSTCTDDASCIQDCVAQGDADSQAAVTALAGCSQTEGADCSAELSACQATGGVAAAPTGGGNPGVSGDQPMLPNQPTPTSADLIPWLTGEWITSNHQFEFYGDGRVRRADAVAMTYGDRSDSTDRIHCVSTLNEIGTVTQEGNVLIMQFDVEASNHCGEKTSGAGKTIRYLIEWIDNPYYQRAPELQLRLRDLDCTAGDMWCLDSMTRR